MFPFVSLLALATLAAQATAVQWQIQEARSSPPPSFVHTGAADTSQTLTMRVNLKQGNLQGLEAKLAEVSTPGSSTFRQWLSNDDVNSYVHPTPETTQAFTSWLSSYNLTSTPLTAAGDWHSFTVPVSLANTMFNTQFGTFTHTGSNTSYIRTLNYSLPAEVADAINAVHPTTSFSGPSKRSPVLALENSIQKRELKERATVPSSCGTQITPACLQALYNIPTTPANGTSAGVIGVAGMGDQYANQADLTAFLQNYRPDIPSTTSFSLTSVDGGTNDQTPANAGVEANLDIQYTVGVATNVPTTFVTVGTQNQDGNDGGFLDIINALLNETSPPKVLTTSYGFDVESDLSLSLTVALCNSYMQLTSKGVSILFATGDGGVASTPGVQCTNKPFPPTFPTCPYVTLVGATGSVPEVGASLSAGGFSNYFAQASWQASAVAGYLKILGSTYAGKYNASGRAYPDVSAQGQKVAIYVDGNPTTVDGTSCSSPIFASVIGLLNDELISTGKGSLGFLNPWLYANPGAFNDITSGSNPGCGTNGFSAAAGWDPVTGLGSPNYTALRIAAGL